MAVLPELDPEQVEGSPLALRRMGARRNVFESQDLRGSDIVLADLTGASLARSDLSFSNAAGAILRHADLSDILARNVNFAMADMEYANLRNADLSGCADWGTSWGGANLENATLPEGWMYEEFVNEVVPAFFIQCGLALKSVVSDRGWTSGPIELAYPEGVPVYLKPVERRMRIFMASGHLRRAQVTSALRKKGVLR